MQTIVVKRHPNGRVKTIHMQSENPDEHTTLSEIHVQLANRCFGDHPSIKSTDFSQGKITLEIDA